MNANELSDYMASDIVFLLNQHGHQGSACIAKEAATMLRKQQAEIMDLKEHFNKCSKAIVDKEIMLRQQQAEIEALKAIINEAFKSIPAMGEDGEFYHEHHGMDGEYLGYENIPANYVVQVIEAILRKAQE